jgi:hypothetical protein
MLVTIRRVFLSGNYEITSAIGQRSVVFISLAVALSSLAYNSWRNEKTEDNRNIRTAGVELLLTLGELERVIFSAITTKAMRAATHVKAGHMC